MGALMGSFRRSLRVVAALASAGVRGILNFAPGTVQARDPVRVRSVDLARELECLAYYLPG